MTEPTEGARAKALSGWLFMLAAALFLIAAAIQLVRGRGLDLTMFILGVAFLVIGITTSRRPAA